MAVPGDAGFARQPRLTVPGPPRSGQRQPHPYPPARQALGVARTCGSERRPTRPLEGFSCGSPRRVQRAELIVTAWNKPSPSRGGYGWGWGCRAAQLMPQVSSRNAQQRLSDKWKVFRPTRNKSPGTAGISADVLRRSGPRRPDALRRPCRRRPRFTHKKTRRCKAAAGSLPADSEACARRIVTIATSRSRRGAAPAAAAAAGIGAAARFSGWRPSTCPIAMTAHTPPL